MLQARGLLIDNLFLGMEPKSIPTANLSGSYSCEYSTALKNVVSSDGRVIGALPVFSENEILRDSRPHVFTSLLLCIR